MSVPVLPPAARGPRVDRRASSAASSRIKLGTTLMLAMLALLGAGSVGDAQEIPDSSHRRAYDGLELRVGWSQSLGVPHLANNGRTVNVGSVSTLTVEQRLMERSHFSLHTEGELLPLRPIQYSRTTRLCLVGCEAVDTHATALQAGLALRATLGPAYASVGIAERGTYASSFAGCSLQMCPFWFDFAGSGFQTVSRMGFGVKPRGSALRPVAEVNLSVYRLGTGGYRRDLEFGGGIAF